MASTSEDESVAPPASSRVAGIYELLEHILESVNTQDLITARKVARNFKFVTDTSRILREKLFLEAQAPVELWYEKDCRRGCVMTKEPGIGGDPGTRGLTLNPLLFSPVRGSCAPDHFEYVDGLPCFPYPFHYGLSRKIALHPNIYNLMETQSIPSGALISNMFLTQPPTHKVHLLYCGLEWETSMRRKSGIRLRDVLEEIGERGTRLGGEESPVSTPIGWDSQTTTPWARARIVIADGRSVTEDEKKMIDAALERGPQGTRDMLLEELFRCFTRWCEA